MINLRRKRSVIHQIAIGAVVLFLVQSCTYPQSPVDPTLHITPTETPWPLPYEAMPTPEDQPLTLLLTLEHTNYRIEEPIEATLVLQNTANEPILMNQRLAANNVFNLGITGEIGFVIQRSSGEMVNMSLRIHPRDIRDSDFQPLFPDETSTVSYNSNDLYDLDADTYRLHALYGSQWNAPDGRVPWKGTVLSNPVTFTIEP